MEKIDRNLIKKIVDDEIKSYLRDKQFNPSKIANHVHNGTDTSLITKVALPIGTPVTLGAGGIISFVTGSGTTKIIETAIIAGDDIGGAPIGSTSNNLQLTLQHQPQNASNQSFIFANRPPLFESVPNSTISTTSGGSTVSITGYVFDTNSLANALIDIYDSAGNFIETQVIASNTSNVITISSTWLSTTTNGTFKISQPVFLGSADNIWQRFYTQEGTGAGIRFGIGPTAGGQNGLLYMDATGDLYWRNKSGTSTKLN